MDVRYNVIEWVPRSAAGWSIGNAVTDPRTGEIINGHVAHNTVLVRHTWTWQRMLQHLQSDAVALVFRETGHTLGLMHGAAAQPS